MGILGDFLTSPLGEVGYGAMSELYDQANVRAGEQQKMFLGLGDDLRAERRANSALFNEKLSNFRAMELDFINNAPKWDPKSGTKFEDYMLDILSGESPEYAGVRAEKPKDIKIETSINLIKQLIKEESQKYLMKEQKRLLKVDVTLGFEKDFSFYVYVKK